MAPLDRIFKAYDVRGVVPDDLDEDVARRIGAAFAEWSGARKILLGRDCRVSSPALAAATAGGAPGGRPLPVAPAPATGGGGGVVPPGGEPLPLKLVHLFPELDGTFPNHPADPIQPENQRDLRRTVLERRADIGLAFDG